MDQEVVGLEMLERMGEALFPEGDPAAFQYAGRSEHLREMEDRYEMIIALPFLEKRDVSLLRYGEELVVQVGQYRRNIILPQGLRGLNVEQANMEDGVLPLRFSRKTTNAGRRSKE